MRPTFLLDVQQPVSSTSRLLIFFLFNFKETANRISNCFFLFHILPCINSHHLQPYNFAMIPRQHMAAKLRPLVFITPTRCFSHASTCYAAQARASLSKFWVPTGGISETDHESGHSKLIRAGFLRQTQSGIFHLLPLGVRVQDKIAKVIDKHMESIGASRLAMSSLTTEDLWRKSGRFENIASELFQLQDRKEMKFMLGPTHEEEITTLVASTLKSYKDLPIRLYQTSMYRVRLPESPH